MFDPFLTSSFWASAILGAGPIVFATLGSLLCSRAGILFVGVEGTLLAAAFFSIAGAIWTDSLVLGTLFGAVAGMLTGLLFGGFAMTLRMGDIVAGLVIQIGMLGLTAFLQEELFPNGQTVGNMTMKAIWPSFGGEVGRVLFHQPPLVYIALIAAVAIAWFLKTSWGLRVRTSGESLKVARTLGLPLVRMRFAVLAASGVLTGLGGAMLGLAVVGTFTNGIVSGRGFIALACVMLAAWRPLASVVAAVGFAAAYAYGFSVDSKALGDWVQLLPYVLTVVVVGLVWGRRAGPAEEGKGLGAEA
jgi:general nucleoside transport system permease protein